ncbi:hypothetical protein D0865_16596 [Hortaea werneckii]|uniref:O-methyltransferase domain-containing protein n=1 Tax=Hortaea werneckii TaxID=91943 RepID=A0A3M7A3A2_HORWE|nr:hypothetical protein D0865_16596 [Hortaea werneckii]
MGTADVSSDPIQNDSQTNYHTKHLDPENLSRRPDPNPPPRFPPTVPIQTAILPSDDAAVPDLLHNIQVTGQDYTTNHLRHDSTDRNQKNSTRLTLLCHARALVRALETPRETMIKHCWAEPSAAMCLAVGVDTGLFHYLSCNDAGCPYMEGRGEGGKQGRGEGQEEETHSPPSISHPSHPDDKTPDPNHPHLLTRRNGHRQRNPSNPPRQPQIPHHPLQPYRHRPLPPLPPPAPPNLHAPHPSTNPRKPSSPPLSRPPSPTRSSATALTPSSTPPPSPPSPKFPVYAKRTAYREPCDPEDGPRFRGRCWSCFGDHMGGYRRGRRSWWEERFFNPVRERVLVDGAGLDGVEGEEEEDGEGKVLLVDVGGSFGHDIREFAAAFGDVAGMGRGRGRLVLEDLPEVVGQIREEALGVGSGDGEEVRIERMGCDFFQGEFCSG